MKRQIVTYVALISAFVFGGAALLTAGSQIEDKTKNRPQYVISVTQGEKKLGDITIELFPDVAPKHAANFDSLVSVKFYDGTAFHRVIPGFMIQGGSGNSKNDKMPRQMWGQSAQGQTMVPAEFSDMKHKRGVISAARLGNDINSATSQFFIMVADATHLDGQYSIYGRVLKGMEVADAIVATKRDRSDNPIKTIRMTVKKIK